MKTQLQFLSNTFLLIVKYSDGILGLGKSVVTVFSLWYNILFGAKEMAFS